VVLKNEASSKQNSTALDLIQYAEIQIEFVPRAQLNTCTAQLIHIFRSLKWVLK